MSDRTLIFITSAFRASDCPAPLAGFDIPVRAPAANACAPAASAADADSGLPSAMSRAGAKSHSSDAYTHRIALTTTAARHQKHGYRKAGWSRAPPGDRP